jgi:phosphatidate cytidylyltransferase
MSKLPDLLPRVLTALVLIPLVLSGIFFLSPFYFSIFSGIIVLLASWEWSRLSGIENIKYRITYIILILLALILSLYISLFWILITGVIIWLFIFISLFLSSSRKWGSSFLGLIMLPVFWRGINYLCFLNPHPYKLLTLFLIVWLADIAAYFVGCNYGKHKLAPKISPGKSIEGAIGALIVVGIVIALIFHSLYIVILALLTVVISIIGDLFESLMKRQQGLKDSGKLLPGHGGILDRIDSLLAAVPLFALGLMILGN